MRSITLILALSCLLLAAAPLAAQNTIFVDPVNGSDVTGDGSASNPYQSLTHALSTNPLPGTTVELRSGPYNSTHETFPITLRDRISIRPGTGQFPVFDGDNADAVIQVDTDITQALTVSFFQIVDCKVGLRVNAGQRVAGLTVSDTLFENFTQAGVQMALNTGQNTVTVRNCDFVGNGADFGVFLSAEGSSGAALFAGAVEDCSILDCDTGIQLAASGGADVGDDFSLRRNNIEGHTLAGITLSAQPGVGNGSFNSALVQGNQIKGDGATATPEIGLQIAAQFLFGSAQTAQVDARILYNAVFNNHTNVFLSTSNQVGGGEVNITSAFTGNTITGASSSGIVFAVSNPAALRPNASPNFGDLAVAPSGSSGRNTIQGNGTFEMVLDGDMQNVIKAENNFWNQNSSVAILNRIQTNGALPPSVIGFLSSSANVSTSPQEIPERTATAVNVRAPSGFRFVDNPDDDSAIGQLLALVGQALVEAFVFDNGSGLQFTSPMLAEGDHDITIVNPGGQTAAGTLRVVASGGGGGSGSGMCVVASAAHGGYDAPEVRVLRRLRDDYLLMTPAGRAFTRSYYAHGPALAGFIAERPLARAATRAALAPPVAVARALLAWNAGQRFAAGVALLGLVLFLVRRRR
ncbi:MAG: DUF1565 domain-containing protein [Planctomycetota bacterium]|nr:MAG: DUF1565 domain-containing protein [Planctomycetota bacterium]